MDVFSNDSFSPRTSLDPSLANELRQRSLDPSDCIRLSLVRHSGLGPSKLSFRPLSLSGRPVWQLEQTNGKQISVQNFSPGPEAEAALNSLLSSTGAREYHLTAAKGDLHVRITRKGHCLVSRSKPALPSPSNTTSTSLRPHDHSKNQPLSRFDSSTLLHVLGISDANGNIRASMRGKTDQINAFLRELDALLDEENISPNLPFHVVDCGCGRAYLTLSAFFYLSLVHGLPVSVTGIDRNSDIIKTASKMASDLGVSNSVQFISADLANCSLNTPPDLILSLHACDVATDLAIACGTRLNARYMLIAPCCQHDLQKQIKDSGPMRALLRHSILRERLADLLTDAFRAQILRILGYRVRITEFVSPEATARNIMIRANKCVKAGQPGVVNEYLEMRDSWHVTPVLETILADFFTKFLR